MINTRYNVFLIQVDRAGEIVRFQHKIPAYLKQCTGFQVRHAVGIETVEPIAEVGWLTASFNNLKDEVLTSVVSVPAMRDKDETRDYQSLNLALQPGQILSGTYVDSNRVDPFMPYLVSLYLRCKQNPELTEF